MLVVKVRTMGPSGGRARPKSRLLPVSAAVLLLLSSCSLLPREFNLSPLYRHRLDEQGKVLEMDVLWPIIHYETRADGGTDFRIRPFYRRVREAELPGFGEPFESQKQVPADAAAFRHDHQFLWPLGRVRSGDWELHARFFPLLSYDQRRFSDGGRESDWYLLFPFIWGGSSHKDPSQPAENYLGLFPIYLDAPGQFLTYDRFTTILWPLYTRTEKDGNVGHVWLWPFIGYSGGQGGKDTWWYRVLPFFNAIGKPGQYARYALLWPFFGWGTDNMDGKDPLHSWHFWPLYSRQRSESGRISSWSFLWPFFRSSSIGEEMQETHILWPFVHWMHDKRADENLRRWWFWPFLSRTQGRHQSAWSVLWPLIWWREYEDPDGVQRQRWVLPFYRWVERQWIEGGKDSYLMLWPLWHDEESREGTGDEAFPSLFPARGNNANGVHAAYDWLWTVYKHQQRAPEDRATQLTAHIYSTRTRGRTSQSSVPLLFSYERTGSKKTLNLFNLIPISWGSESPEPVDEDPQK